MLQLKCHFTPGLSPRASRDFACASGSVPKKITETKSRGEVLLFFNVRDQAPHFWMKFGRCWFPRTSEALAEGSLQLGKKKRTLEPRTGRAGRQNREARLLGSALKSGRRMTNEGDEWKRDSASLAWWFQILSEEPHSIPKGR